MERPRLDLVDVDLDLVLACHLRAGPVVRACQLVAAATPPCIPNLTCPPTSQPTLEMASGHCCSSVCTISPSWSELILYMLPRNCRLSSSDGGLVHEG